MMREGKDRTMRWFALCGRAMQRWENPHAAPAIRRLFEQDAAALENEAVILNAKLDRAARSFSRQRQRIFRSAEMSHGAVAAFWPYAADEGSQFHERGIMFAGVRSWQKPSRGAPKRFTSGGAVDGRLQIEEAGEDTADIRFDDRDGLIERERRHCVCRVAANAR